MSTQSIRVFARVYWAEAPSVGAVLTLSGPFGSLNNGLAQDRPSSVAPQSLTITSAGSPAGGRRSGVLDKTVALQSLTPGSYVLSVEARPVKGKAVRRDVPFEIR